jgi:tetratricopeptide (TPR) repeat protein
MNTPVVTPNLDSADSSALSESRFGRRLFLILGAVALVYALLAGLRTISEYDLGWQMATARWIMQHHQVPSTDVLSYTAYGQPWIYPVDAGLLFYAAYLLDGFALISWISAAACCGTVALLLRRGSAVTAAIAILAVPLIAYRTGPRADMFTVVLFAAFLSLLWKNYQTGRAHLWLLPLLMLLWVNLHFGFAAGLALLVAYAGVELCETPLGEARRRAALIRLRRSAPWLVATVFATLVNPWGWGIYRALLRQQRASGQQHLWIMEWHTVPVSWTAFSTALAVRQTAGAIYLLLVIALVAGLLALGRRQWGAAILLLAAMYPAVRYVRMGSVFACVVVILGGAVLTDAIAHHGSLLPQPGRRQQLAIAAVLLFALLASLRSFDLVTNRHYFRGIDVSNFGTGLSWWFPQRAAEFVEREQLRGEIFNTFDGGGYLAWRLGQQHRINIDGRDTLFGIAGMQHNAELLRASPDSAAWQQEADRYGVNTIILPLGRFDGVQLVNLGAFCSSRTWRPVYLDEVSGVFVRRSPATEALIARTHVDCSTASLPAPPLDYSPAGSFNQLANAASLLAALGRTSEALSATEEALSAFPDSAFMRWLHANLLYATGRRSEAGREYVTAANLDPSEATWSSLATFYQQEGRAPEAIHALRQTAGLSMRPDLALIRLAHFYLANGQPAATLQALDEAVRSAPAEALTGTGEASIQYDVARGRSAAWEERGDLGKAASFEEEAVRLAPNDVSAWSRLAQIYQRQGRFADEYRAEARAAALGSTQAH